MPFQTKIEGQLENHKKEKRKIRAKKSFSAPSYIIKLLWLILE
jgi:hypothetical protein